MASISSFLDLRYQTKGKHAIKILLSHNKQNAQYSLGIYLEKEYWQPATHEGEGYVKKTHPQHKMLNHHIRTMCQRFDEQLIILEQQRRLNTFASARDLKNHIVAIIEGRNEVTFLQFFKTVVDTRACNGTRKIFRETYNRLLAFTNGRDISFEQITPKWLDEFNNFMNGCINYKSIHLRNIRTAYNLAIRNDIAKYDTYPFRKYKIKKEKTVKRSLSIEQLCDICDMDLLQHQERYRDLFMLSFYLIGINAVDLLHLTAENIQGDRLVYKRRKTGRNYSLKLEKEALSLIDKYRGDRYLLNFLDTASYDSMISRINKNLKELGETTIVNSRGKKIKSTQYKFLSTYFARHTWATIAAYLDIPKETIAAALGHGGNDVTDIYINFDQTKVDKANRRVIDYLNTEREKKSGKKEKRLLTL